MPIMTDTETRTAIIGLMNSNAAAASKARRKGQAVRQPWNPDDKPFADLIKSRWGERGYQVARKMEEDGEIEVVRGLWIEGMVQVIAGSKFSYPGPDSISRHMAYIAEPIRDIVTEDFLRECEEVAAEMEALDKRRVALWEQIADKVRDLPDLDTAQKVFNEISYACATKDGQFRQPIFNVERAFVYDHFKYGEGAHRVHYAQVKHEPTDNAEGFLPAGSEKL